MTNQYNVILDVGTFLTAKSTEYSIEPENQQLLVIGRSDTQADVLICINARGERASWINAILRVYFHAEKY